MIQQQPHQRHTTELVEDFAAELTEAAYPVALEHCAGIDWLDRKLDLWHALTRTVNAWAGQNAARQSH
jgi:hypothetical protein